MRKILSKNYKNLYTLNEIKLLNDLIKKNKESKNKDWPAESALKTSSIEVVAYSHVAQLMGKFINFCYTTNEQEFGFDLFPITSNKALNYNIYETGNEYSWHIDATPLNPVRDIKLTAIINCSDQSYSGGELVLFRGKKFYDPEFETPGSVIIFPSYINHRVNKISSGVRKTLSMWMSGPKFR